MLNTKYPSKYFAAKNIECEIFLVILQAGTEDGCVVLFDTDYHSLQYYRSFDKQEGMLPD